MRFVLTMGLGVVILCAGCANELGFQNGEEIPYNPKAAGGDVGVQRDIQFADIPVPQGFVLRPDEYYSFASNAFRMGEFKYEGLASHKRTSAFYLAEMQRSGWEHLETTCEKAGDTDIETQLYAKKRERCEIIIKAAPDGTAAFVRVYNLRGGDREPAMARGDAPADGGTEPAQAK
jgi:hypothetical protein